MINTSLDEIKFTSNNKPITATIPAIELLYTELRHARGPTPQVFFEETNKAARAVYAPLEWLDSVRGIGITQEQVQAAYDLSVLGTSNENLERTLFIRATGIKAATIREVRGFKTPLRALMLCLWRHGYLLLPISFKQNSVSSMVPSLIPHLENFFSDIAYRGTNANLKKYLKCTQFTLDWHTIDKFDFSEAWDAIPKISDGRKIPPTGKFKFSPFRNFFLVPWIEQFYWQHPELVSAKQVELIQAYSAAVGVSRYDNYQFETPEQFAEYYYKSQKEKNNIQAKAYNERAQKKQKQIRLKGNSESEIYFANISINDRKDFNWILKNGYLGIPQELTTQLSTGWVRYLTAYNHHLLERNIGKSQRKQLLAPVYKLCDYLFGYLVKWREENPLSSVPIPLRVDDFSAVFFWKRLLPLDDLQFEQFGPMPLTLLDAVKLQIDRPVSASFVRGIYEFFEFCIENRTRFRQVGIYALDEDFTNPISLKDSPGSGPRNSGTDKFIIPAFSIGILRHYVSALDCIGRNLRERSLSQKISVDKLREISQSEWINLSELELEYTLTTNSPSETGKTIEIRLTEIPNCYVWCWGNYHVQPKSQDQIFTGVPWLSPLRMIAIGLFAGQRLQSAQWLGLDNYRSKHQEGTSYWTGLYLYIDKTYPDRTCRLQRYIMEWLDDEAQFQTMICDKPPEPCFYENDEYSGHPKTRWLFRSPYGKSDTPFTDSVYTDKWIRILRGVEQIWNSIAPKEFQYNFVLQKEHSNRTSKSGAPRYVTPHTPHSLRNSYITWMMERGEAEPDEVRKQVGHRNLIQTFHYASGQRPGTDYTMEIADQRIESFDNELFGNLLTDRPIKASASNSVLRNSLLKNRGDTIEAQGMISLSDGIIPAKETGYDLIKVALIEDLGFFDVCICVFNGRCTTAVLAVTKGPRRCGMCPYAIYALDHLEGINARMRSLQREIMKLSDKIRQLETCGESELTIKAFREDKSLSSIELCGYEQVTNLLNATLASAKNRQKRYLIRDPEILSKHPIALMTKDPIQKIVGDLLDASHFPAFANENYLVNLRRAARLLKLEGFTEMAENENPTPKTILGQIASQMRVFGWTLDDLSRNFRLHYPQALNGIDHG
ncbi:hypothetical protein DOZ80_03085 [Pseudomonas fluorescens]|uniref:Uncharacterized protein n=1 Tax=Pseudomonas fluorescens TaxID=294 RepID=A0A327NE54_PSEFL|nr:site-specific integrase [Pseudomonas fluorescens]RAI72539.1 hypothetical protein DOZ80_03085 [Pseudomonas fluorescens]